MKTRKGKVRRETGETAIGLELILEGEGHCTAETGLGFFDHMLHLLAKHAGWNFHLETSGDLEVDDHHLVEDVGIVLGQALCQAVGEKQGIERYGSILLPMDEVLVAVAIDLGGRSFFSSDYRPQREQVGALSTEMVNHFFQSLVAESRMNLHFNFLSTGDNEHHRIEAMFKGFARAMRTALRIDPERSQEIPSTKGSL